MAVATLGGLLISAASLVVAILQMFPVVRRSRVNVTAAAAALGDDIRDQWLGEAGARSIRDKAILPVTWTVAASEVADREQPAHPWAAVGRGRLDGDFDTAAAEIATEYRRVGNGRLVILGQPGVGKTVIAMLLTVGLLPNRSSEANHPPPSRGNPVPVLLSASSWDPICEPFDDWIVRTVALSHFNGETTVPRQLLDERLLLPVVDGLDEIPESARRTAVHRINRAIDTNRPIVVTCRTAEFEDVIRGGAPVLHRSPVIQVMPVSPADAVDYLRRVVDDPNREGWQRIYDTVRHAPDSPLAEALSTPLMLSILVAVYGDARAHPEELLDAATYHSRHTIEDHLLDHAITARFAGPGAGRYRCDAEQATRWLTFLATYLHRHRERDLAWWRMSERLLPQLAVPAIGLLLGLVLMVVGALVARPLIVLSTGKEDIESALGIGASTGGAFAVLFLLIWYAVPTRLPGRLSWSPSGSWRRVRRSLLVGFAVLIMPGAAVLVAVLATLPLVDNWTYVAVYTATASGVLVAAAGCVLGIGLAADAWLSAPPERSTQPSPAGFLRHDRRSALVGAAAAALAVAATIPPLELVSTLLGDWIAHAVAANAGVGPRPDGVKVLDPSSQLDPSDWVSRVSAAVVPGVAVGLLVLLTRAWPRFLVARAYLAVRGQLPWRLPAFLAEARARGLLRESGGMYQFHHARLQERLASRPAAEAPQVSPASAPEPLPWSHRRRKALLAASTALIILVAATATILDAPPRVTPIRLQPPTIVNASSYFREVGLSRDGSVLAVARDDVLDVWHLDLEAGYGRYAGVRLPESFPDVVQAVAVSSSGDRIAVATETGLSPRRGRHQHQAVEHSGGKGARIRTER
ncbi:NACHT domain-containing protein [Micromonospora sp. WMMD558]|uniref:NACHT domain-containing protein n=1 Tax=Micromonospora sp. WMMD558 TaxID=3403462 RepID=UPI003BF5DF8F